MLMPVNFSAAVITQYHEAADSSTGSNVLLCCAQPCCSYSVSCVLLSAVMNALAVTKTSQCFTYPDQDKNER